MSDHKNTSRIKLPSTPKDFLIILAIITLGVLLVNQTLGYRYKSRFLQTPCDLCEELKQQLKPNPNNQFIYELNQKVVLGSPEVLEENNHSKFNYIIKPN